MDVQARYDRIAPRYDIASRLPVALGFTDRRYHRAAVDLLAPEPGSTVLVVGCGTGIDFARIQRHIGPGGRIIGVDLSGGMLAQAREKCARRGWSNVELHHADMQSWTLPAFDHALASFTLRFMPKYKQVVKRLHAGLPTGGRLAIADFRLPRGLRLIGALLLRPFAQTGATIRRRPDEAVRRVFGNLEERRFWFGGAYALVATKGA